MNRKILSLMSGTLLLCATSPMAFGDRAFVTGEILRLLTADQGRWGECMVELNADQASTGLDCTTNFVTFSCSGVHTSRSNAKVMYETAQIAFALNKRVQIQIDDELKHNGHCFGASVRVFR